MNSLVIALACGLAMTDEGIWNYILCMTDLG